MNNRSNDYSDYSDEELERIHSASEKFEQQIQRDPSIHIESFMEEVQEDLRTPLFMELLAIEVEWRSSRGQTPETAEYEDRFPDRRTEIEIFFQQRQQ